MFIDVSLMLRPRNRPASGRQTGAMTAEMARRIGLGEHAADSGRMTLCGFRHAAQEALRVPARQFTGHPGIPSGRDPAKASLDSKLPSDRGRGSPLERVCNNLARLLGERAGAAHILPRGRDWGMHPQARRVPGTSSAVPSTSRSGVPSTDTGRSVRPASTASTKLPGLERRPRAHRRSVCLPER